MKNILWLNINCTIQSNTPSHYTLPNVSYYTFGFLTAIESNNYISYNKFE